MTLKNELPIVFLVVPSIDVTLGKTNLISSLAGATDRGLSNFQIIIIFYPKIDHFP